MKGHNRVPIDNSPLDVDYYYFLGPPKVEAHKNYAIIKNFSGFTFPDTLPEDWAAVVNTLQQTSYGQHEPPQASSMSLHVKTRGPRCAVTKYLDCALFYLVDNQALPMDCIYSHPVCLPHTQN